MTACAHLGITVFMMLGILDLAAQLRRHAFQPGLQALFDGCQRGDLSLYGPQDPFPLRTTREAFGEVLKVHDATIICTPRISQVAGIAALTEELVGTRFDPGSLSGVNLHLLLPRLRTIR